MLCVSTRSRFSLPRLRDSSNPDPTLSLPLGKGRGMRNSRLSTPRLSTPRLSTLRLPTSPSLPRLAASRLVDSLAGPLAHLAIEHIERKGSAAEQRVVECADIECL